jgi:PUA domain protein
MKVKRTPIRRKDAKKILEDAKLRGITFSFEKFNLAEIIELEEEKILLIDASPTLIIFNDGKVVPHILSLGKTTKCPAVMVDENAVNPIMNGADIMMPGIVKFNNFKKDDAVAIFSKELMLIAVGVALINSSEIVTGGKGKVILNLHRKEDKFYLTF